MFLVMCIYSASPTNIIPRGLCISFMCLGKLFVTAFLWPYTDAIWKCVQDPNIGGVVTDSATIATMSTLVWRVTPASVFLYHCVLCMFSYIRLIFNVTKFKVKYFSTPFQLLEYESIKLLWTGLAQTMKVHIVGNATLSKSIPWNISSPPLQIISKHGRFHSVVPQWVVVWSLLIKHCQMFIMSLVY